MLTEAMLVLLAIFSGVSALDVTKNFHFAIQPRIFRRNDDVCQLCYGETDCFVMDRARCKYNAETTDIFKEVEEKNSNTNNDMKKKVDSMMYDLIIKQSIEQNFKKCIPLMSSYTNCNRENICTGCETCDCDVEGRWNCTLVHQCRPESINIDHRVLVIVMEHLKSGPDSFRIKRSSGFEEKVQRNTHYDELSEWWYGAKVLTDRPVNESKTTETLTTHVTEATTVDPSTSTSNIIATEEATKNLAFDDVLREIKFDIKNVSDVSGNVKINKGQSNASNTEQFLQMLAAEEGNDLVDTADGTPNVVVDLLGDSSNFVMDTGNSNKNDANGNTERQALGDTEADFNKDMETMNFANLVNIMKRDVSKVTETTTKNVTNNMTDAEILLRKNVLDPMTKVIREKNAEIYQLTNIKDNLLKFMQSYNFNLTLPYDGKISNDNSFFVYKEDDNSFFNKNFRRAYGYSNVLILKKYEMKLKHDVTAVLRDIAGIRKYQNSKVLPNDLKLLLQAIKYFIGKNKDNPKGLMNTALKRYKNPRRVFETSNAIKINDIKKALVEIIKLIDQDMPTLNALSPLSPRTKKCLKRIINNNYLEDLTIFGSRVHPQYNLTIILKSIGNTWHETTANVINSSPTERLYNMKILYFTLSRDIIKITDALTLLQFVHSRRMTGIDENVGIEIVDRINTDLGTINSEIIRYIQNENTEFRMQTTTGNNTKRKGSLLKKIKTLLTNSRKNFVKLLHTKQSTSNSSKNTEFNNIEDADKQKFLEAMQRWQNYLDVSSVRNKRAVREYRKHIKRMKNIIPQYLRGKVNPALDAKGKGMIKTIDTNNVRLESKAQTHGNTNKMPATTQKPKTTTMKLNKMKRRH